LIRIVAPEWHSLS